MWVDVKNVAEAAGRSPRTIQMMARDGKIQSRPKNQKSIEIYVPSLPPEWQTKLVKAGNVPSLENVSTATTAALAPAAQLTAIATSASAARLGAKVTERQRQRLLIAQRVKARPAGTPKTEWISSVASYYGISTSTVRRIASEVDSFGAVGRPRDRGVPRAWDAEAIAFIKGYWLQAIREIGECSKTTAWKALQVQAKKMGWKIGSRSSAFALLGEVDHLLVAYARGGNRALDNYFYITRDADTLQPMQIVIGDQHIFDWWVADYETGLISRPECYLWLDMATKLIYGIAFDKSYNSETVKESLRLGLYRFGAFDCTYNDNGSSECSKAINTIIDDLINLQMANADISDLYRTPEGVYVVVDEDGDILDTARTSEEWRRKHRRIFANVRNAKAKDIERFFRTLEGMLLAKMLPGRVATPGAPAAIDEVERQRLEVQKNRRELLTIEEFQVVVLETLREYENTLHSTLKMTPLQKLQQKINGGWKPRYFEKEVVDITLADRQRRKVDRGRVTIGNVTFIGEDLRAEDGSVADVGLWKHDGQSVEIRFNARDLTYAYAIVDGTIRPLRAVTSVAMLDDNAMTEAIALKRKQMAAVREAFGQFTRPIGGLTIRSEVGPKIRAAHKIVHELPEPSSDAEELKDAVASQIAIAKKKTMPIRAIHTNNRERYRWCLDMIISGEGLDPVDQLFMHSYEGSDEYKNASDYWTTYKRMGGNR